MNNDLACKFWEIYNSLKRYCKQNNYIGWDPFDALNSRIIQKLPFCKNKVCRLFFIQFFKRFPFNLRKFFLIPKGYNSKGVGLFFQAYINEYKFCLKTDRKEDLDNIEQEILFFLELLNRIKSKKYTNLCWGYNFDWQSRAFFQPAETPTIVPTSFIANALIDWYQLKKDTYVLDMIISVCEFIINDLNVSEENDNTIVFSYSPLDHSKIYNASLLAARILIRTSFLLKEKQPERSTKYFAFAQKAVDYCILKQNSDGSWFYGDASNQKWIDSFHTGYNLDCIYEFIKYSETDDDRYIISFRKGTEYYLNNFFTNKGEPKYFCNSKYPFETHSLGQLFVFLSKANLLNVNKSIVDKVLNWGFDNLYDHKKSYFYYRKNKFFTNKISYIRWSNAWMLYSLSYLFDFYGGAREKKN